jgi:hypothetical protein
MGIAAVGSVPAECLICEPMLIIHVKIEPFDEPWRKGATPRWCDVLRNTNKVVEICSHAPGVLPRNGST